MFVKVRSFAAFFAFFSLILICQSQSGSKMGLMMEIVFLSLEQKVIHLPSPPSTDWLTHSCVRIMLSEIWQRWKSILWPNSYKISGNKSPGQRSLEDLEATTWSFSLKEYLAKNNNKSQTLNLFIVLAVQTNVRTENLLLDKKKNFKISSRGKL